METKYHLGQETQRPRPDHKGWHLEESLPEAGYSATDLGCQGDEPAPPPQSNIP